MIYLRIIDEQIHYPYTLGMLMSAYPDISFPDVMDDELLADFGVYSVEETLAPEATMTQKVLESYPIVVNGQYRQQWDIVYMNFVEILTLKEEISNEIRKKRNKKLLDSDWIIISNIEKKINTNNYWIDYRQNLRDIPLQNGFPYNVIWPVKPLTEI